MEIVELNIKNENERIEFNSIMANLYLDLEYIEKQNQISEYNLITTYILKENEHITARLALYKSKDNALYFFGNFEALSIQSGVEIIKHLKLVVTEKFRQAKIIGPMNGNTWYNYRIALDNNKSLFKNDLCNPAYYSEILTKSGFEMIHHFESNLQSNFVYKKHILKPEFKVIFLSPIELLNRINEIYEITMQAFKNAPYFIPIPFSHFEIQFKKQLNFINLELSPFIINSKQAICAYSSCYLNIEGDSIVVKTIARKQGREFAGLGRNLSNSITEISKNKGFKSMIHAFMHSENSSKILSENNHGITIKNYALFQWQS